MWFWSTISDGVAKKVSGLVNLVPAERSLGPTSAKASQANDDVLADRLTLPSAHDRSREKTCLAVLVGWRGRPTIEGRDDCETAARYNGKPARRRASAWWRKLIRLSDDGRAKASCNIALLVADFLDARQGPSLSFGEPTVPLISKTRAPLGHAPQKDRADHISR
jgi:hypothetical protein